MPPRIAKRFSITVFKPEQGFVLPIILGVGLVMILLGVMMIERSSQNRIAATAQKAKDQSLVAAENGLTQLQVLFNRYRLLATACSNQTLSSFCNSVVPWSNLSEAALDPCSTSSTQPLPLLQDYANQRWQNVSVNPNDGQFRLISYQYQLNADDEPLGSGTGTLVIEGRVNPDDAIRTATTQLKVTFNVTHESGLGNPPGLWIQHNQTTETPDSVQFLTQVRDSTCLGDPASSTPVQQLQAQTQSPYVYQPTPGIPFPDLPTEGSSPPAAKSGAYTLDSIDNDVMSLPRSTQNASAPKDEKETSTPTAETDTNSSGILTYRIQANNGLSINLDNPAAILKLGTGSETVVLYLDGGLTVTGGGKIQLVAGSSLIIYAHGPVILASNGTTPAIEQEGTPSSIRTQIYVYSPPPPPPSSPPYEVRLSGDALLYLTLLAPTSTVLSSAQVQGSIWANAWQGSGSAVVKQDPVNISDLKLIWQPRISPITEWKRQENS